MSDEAKAARFEIKPEAELAAKIMKACRGRRCPLSLMQLAAMYDALGLGPDDLIPVEVGLEFWGSSTIVDFAKCQVVKECDQPIIVKDKQP